MNSIKKLYWCNPPDEEITSQNNSFSHTIKFSAKNQRKLLKVFLLARIYQLIYESFLNEISSNQPYLAMESYAMDSKIIQFLIQSIIETGEYTLEGIAYATHIPFDVIYDAACGIKNQFSITPWARVIDLYMQVKPDVARVLIDRLLEVKDTHPSALSLLLNES